MSAGRKHISDKKDWNTPPKYIKLIKEMFGDVDLDPCSNESSMVDAKTKYILPINGLTESWDYKRIFVNPPYGRNVENSNVQVTSESMPIGNMVLCEVNYNAYDTWLEPYIGWKFKVFRVTKRKVMFFMDGGNGKQLICSHHRHLFNLT
jgi:hypothetical protein